MRTRLILLTALGLVAGLGIAVAAAPPPAGAQAAPAVSPVVTVTNIDGSGNKVTRFDTQGNAVDAHDGEIQQFTYHGVTRYYWYGTQDDCGLNWGLTQISGAAEPTPWCGYAIYSSDDLTTWRFEGTIASSSNPTMASTCNWNSCWRPRVVFDPNTNLYVAWGNTLLGPSGYSAWTAPSPVGPWTARSAPVVSTNQGAVSPIAPANQDEALFVDQDGTGYVVITNAGGGAYSPVVERLRPDFLGTTGVVGAVPLSGVEAPSMFQHGNRYYLFVSRPNAGFATTATAYLSAPSPLGPWTYGGVISSDSFGGQPTWSGTWRTTDGGSMSVFQSDLWYQPGALARNQGQAGFDVSPITWASDGVTPVISPAHTWSGDLRFTDSGIADQTLPSSAYHSSDAGNWHVACDVGLGVTRSFTYTSPAAGVLTDLQVPVARYGFADDDGYLDLAAGSNTPGPAVLATATLPASGAGWSARGYTWHPDVAVTAGTTYTVTLRSSTRAAQSCYGFASQAGSSAMGTAYRRSGSGAWTSTGEVVKFDLAIRPVAPRGPTTVGVPVRLADASIEGGYAADIQVTGVGGVPDTGVIGAWVDVTVTNPAASGTLVAYPGDGPTTKAVSFPYRAGVTRSYSALVRVGGDGTIRLSSTSDVAATLDLTGWVADDTLNATGGRLAVLPTPVRTTQTAIGPGGDVDVQVTGAAVPPTATAALVNLTALSTTASTSVSAFSPSRTDRFAPTVAISPGQPAVSNRVLVPLTTDGRVRLGNRAGQVVVDVDVVGYVYPASGIDGEVAPLDPVALTSPDPTANPATFALTGATLGAVAGPSDQGSALVALGQLTAAPATGTLYRAGGTAPATNDVTSAGSQTSVNLAAVNLNGASGVAVARQSSSGTTSVAVSGWVVASIHQHAPSPPVGVSAGAGSGTLSVSWSAPTDVGGLPITAYRATASPSGASCTWVSGPLSCSLAGLADGTGQTVTVTATNGWGTSAPSAPFGPVTPQGSGYTPMTPTRILDTRTGPIPAGDPAHGPLAAGAVWTLPVGGTYGVPANATAVVINVTATDVSAATFVTVWPAGQAAPATSNLNVTAGDTRANLATVALGTGGALSLRNALGTADLVVDLAGYYSVASPNRFTALVPHRLLDTRSTGAALGRDQSLTLAVAGHGGVPGNATAVVVNLTATDTTAPTAVTAYPAGQALPLASNVNLGPGATRPNRVVVAVGSGGAIALHNMFGSTDVIVDVVGAFGPSGTDLFQPSAPVRILDTRTSLVPAGWAPGHPLGPNQTSILPISGRAGVPSYATAIVMNVTATDVTASTFVAVSPAGSAVAATSDLNPVAGETAANLVMATLGSAGAVQVTNLSGTLDLVADVGGWFYDPASAS